MRDSKGKFIKGSNDIIIKKDYAILKVKYKDKELDVLIDKDDIDKVSKMGT